MKCVTLQDKEINQVCFDTKTREMFVRFRNGDTRVFVSCNEEIFNDLTDSSDPDAYYRSHLSRLFSRLER